MDGQCAAQQVIQAGLDTADSIARSIGTSVVMRRQAWLRGSGFMQDVQAKLLDLRFDGARLFGEKADSALERFKDSKATAKSLGLQPVQRSYRQFCRFRGFSREFSFRGRQQFGQQQPWRSYGRPSRGRGT